MLKSKLVIFCCFCGIIGLSCLVVFKPNTNSAIPVGFISMVLPPKIRSNNSLLTFNGGIIPFRGFSFNSSAFNLERKYSRICFLNTYSLYSFKFKYVSGR